MVFWGFYLTLKNLIMIILGITTLLVIATVVYWIRSGEEFSVIILLSVILFGYGFFASVIPTKQTKTIVNISYACSEEMSECRVRELKNHELFTFTDYLTMKRLMEKSSNICGDKDTAILVELFNSYGVVIQTKLIIE